ncbi:MAG: efflux RND transporter permease subunit [Parvibaculum sp.]|uniref:efflux RND transporter permease subunit n=1 Tax=Parvibaculum sp. TaxID=2024848 RepID=UPI003C75A364
MPNFFIDRPIFAWVVALFIIIAGVLAIPQLPVAQYPSIAPPSVNIMTSYPGASAETLYESVTKVIENELNGADGLMYYESQSDAYGIVQINATFEPGTNEDLAAVDVQNRIKRVEPRLPQSVSQQGIQVEKASSNFLLVVSLISTDGSFDQIALGDYLSRNVINEVRRVSGVGKAQLFATERAMRIWIDPDKLASLKLSAQDVSNAIATQNAQVASGTIGAQPSLPGQQIAATVIVQGQLTSPEEFGNIILRANPNGSTVRLHDVAKIEVGGQDYQFSARLNGKPSAAIGVQLAPKANALQTANAIRAKLDELQTNFPAGIQYAIPYDTSTFVALSIKQVVYTLLEAVALVFLVMLLFLQNIRYTLIPTIVVPISLLGTFAVMGAMGFSINVLTMFGMVLVIGIIVDDAIVVVENVERIMSEEGLSPRDATRKAMGQITGAVIGITVVLTSVFIPMAFFSGSVGVIYQQFSLSMVVSVLFSAFLALTLTPALCATLLKPVEAGHHHEKTGFFGWFNRVFNRTATNYEGAVANVLARTGRYALVYVALVAVLGFLYMRLPTSFLPVEDQGYLITDVQLPSEATTGRTLDVMKQLEAHFETQKGIANVTSILGFSFSGTGQNAGLSFVTFDDWSERGADESADAISENANGAFQKIRDGVAFAIVPPPIPELGNATGFSFRLQDRGQLGHKALMEARNQLVGLANASPVLHQVRVEGLEDAAQLELQIDRQKANALGVSFDAINSALSLSIGTAYVNDFPNSGRMQRVIVQAEAAQRMQANDLLKLRVRNARGKMVPFSSFATTAWTSGPIQLVGYNGYPTVKIGGNAASGYSTGEAMAEMEKLMTKLPVGFGYEWTGQSLQEKLSGAQAPALLALSILAVFLCLAALYESWSIPLAVLLVIPLGVIGVVLGVTLRDMPDDVYFKVGLITIIGLSAKNAILIIEFAKDLQAQGKGLVEAALEAARLRFRPIIMTSLAFILGVLPLAIASGASSASQRAIGTGVMGGMITATVLAVFLVPLFFVVVRRLFSRKGAQ